MEQNPYAAPRAAVKDHGPEKRSRPVLVWIITLFMAFGVISGIATSLLALLGTPLGGAAAADYMKSMGIGPADHVYTIVVMAACAVGYIDLFRLKRRALPILLALLAVGIAYAIFKAAINPAYRAMFDNGPALWSMAAGWAINLAIIGYVWWLRRKGVLQ